MMLFLDALQYGLTTTGSLWFPAVQFVLGGSRRIICDNEWNNKEPREVTEQKVCKELVVHTPLYHAQTWFL